VQQYFPFHHLQAVFALELGLVDDFKSVALLGRGVSDKAHFAIGAFAKDSGFGGREGEVREFEGRRARIRLDAARKLMSSIPVVQSTLLRAVNCLLAARTIPRLGNSSATSLVSTFHIISATLKRRRPISLCI
jgi:hypothetical protein